MNLFDFIKRKPQQDVNFEPLPVIQVNEDGSMVENPTLPTPDKRIAGALRTKLGYKMDKVGNNLGDYLFGKQATPTDDINADNGELNATISSNPRTGGFFRDFAQGYQENRTTPISLENFGQKKNLATRLGEGMGSLARFGESPLGRSLLVGAAVGLTGGNPLQMLAYGTQTGSLNQQYRNNDKIYRADLLNNAKQQLINSPEFNAMSDTEKAQILTNLQSDENYNALTDDNQKQAMIDEATRAYLSNRQNNQMQDLENQINGLRGYVTNDTYNNLIRSQQIRDNYAYRNMMLENQQRQNEIMNGLRQDQFKAQEEQRKFNNYIAQANLDDKKADRAETRAYNNAKLGIDYAKLEMDRNKSTQKPMSDTQVDKISTFDTAIEDASRIINKYRNPKYKSLFGLGGAIKRNPITAKFDPLVSEFTQDIELFKKTVAKAKEGGRLTDQDQKYYERALMNPNLTQEDFIRLAQKFQNTQITQRNITLKNIAKAGKDVSNFTNDYKYNNSGSTTVGKYKVRVK